jgi:hypothetical protein
VHAGSVLGWGQRVGDDKRRTVYLGGGHECRGVLYSCVLQQTVAFCCVTHMQVMVRGLSSIVWRLHSCRGCHECGVGCTPVSRNTQCPAVVPPPLQVMVRVWARGVRLQASSWTTMRAAGGV